MMTYIGMTSMEAIRSATANAAYTMNMQDKIGTIEVGKLADLLVVIGDPLANIQVLQDKANLEVIIKDGSIVDTTTPLPTPQTYRWETAPLSWADRQVATQVLVRQLVTNKPAWIQSRRCPRSIISHYRISTLLFSTLYS